MVHKVIDKQTLRKMTADVFKYMPRPQGQYPLTDTWNEMEIVILFKPGRDLMHYLISCFDKHRLSLFSFWGWQGQGFNLLADKNLWDGAVYVGSIPGVLSEPAAGARDDDKSSWLPLYHEQEEEIKIPLPSLRHSWAEFSHFSSFIHCFHHPCSPAVHDAQAGHVTICRGTCHVYALERWPRGSFHLKGHFLGCRYPKRN